MSRRSYHRGQIKLRAQRADGTSYTKAPRKRRRSRGNAAGMTTEVANAKAIAARIEYVKRLQS